MEGTEVVVAQVHQVLQCRVKLLHDALDREERMKAMVERNRWTEAPSPVKPALTSEVTRILAPSYRVSEASSGSQTQARSPWQRASATHLPLRGLLPPDMKNLRVVLVSLAE